MTSRTFTAFICQAFIVTQVWAFCEISTPFPLLMPINSSSYLCAVEFEGTDCKGEPIYYEDKSEKKIPTKSKTTFGSLAIQPGCSFFVHKKTSPEEDNDRIYHLETFSISGPSLIDNVDGFVMNETGIQVSDSFESTSCSCNLPAMNCQPVEAYEPIVVCDSLVLDFVVECPYERVMGTEFSEEFQQAMKLSPELNTFFNESLLKKFPTFLEVSKETDYDWFRMPEEIKWPQKAHPDLVVAPPGVIHVVEQLVGRCGGTTVRTEVFRLVRG